MFIPQQQEQAQPVFNPEPQPHVETPPPPFFPPVEPVTQTQTTTTTTTTKTAFVLNPVFPPSTPQFQNQVLDFEAYPASKAPVRQTPPQPVQPQYDMAQFQQALDATPLTTSTTLIQPEPQFVPQNQQPVTIQQVTPPPTQIVPQPNIQATYTPIQVNTVNPKRVVQRRYVTRTAAKPVTYIPTTNPSTQIIQAQQPIVQQTYQTTDTTTVPTTTQYVQPVQTTTVPTTTQYVQPVQTTTVPTATQYPQTKRVPGYQYINKLLDEDFKRGRPIYGDNALQPNKIRLNQVNTPTYKIREISELNKNNIGLSKLGAASSYNNFRITPGFNKLTPTLNTINTPTITTPNIATPTITTPTITTPTITTPTITTPAITTPTVNIPNVTTPTITTPNINIPTINTPNINIPNVTTPNINIPNVTTPTINTPNINLPTLNNIITPGASPNLVNNINNNINTLNTNIGNNVNNVVGNINTGLDKLGKAGSYNVGQNTITPLLNNAGLQTANIAADNVRLPTVQDAIVPDNRLLPQLKEFL